MVAALSNNATACEMLLDAGAILDTKDNKGRTALSMACRYASALHACSSAII
jgi:ankyrin repeat protein